MNAPSLVAIGHVTWDVLSGIPLNLPLRRGESEGVPPGGAVAFASATARSFGVSVGVVTSCAGDYPIADIVDAPDRCVRIPSDDTSTFENRYDAHDDRVQVLHHRGGDISVGDIPEAWRSPDMLFVGPLTQELPVDCLSWFRPRVSCVVPQGWLRSWTEPLPSLVEVSKSPPAGMGAGWDICVVSESEVEDRTLVEWREKAICLVVTKGSDGAALYTGAQNEPVSVPPFAGMIEGSGTDTTGAGDVFAASMLIRYAATGDAETAARYASLCAGLSTRAASWSAVETPPAALIATLTG